MIWSELRGTGAERRGRRRGKGGKVGGGRREGKKKWEKGIGKKGNNRVEKDGVILVW